MSEYDDNSLVCPITFSLFEDPVLAEDGHVYERNAIIDWIQRNGTSPLTRQSITIEGLRSDYTVKKAVDQFRKSLKKHNCKFKLGFDIERRPNPIFQTTGKSLYDAEWIGNPNGPPIVLLKLDGARAEKEASFYERLTRHPHIVYTYGLVDRSRNSDSHSTAVMLLQEKAPSGNLQNLLEYRLENQSNKPFSDALINEIFFQITEAMIFLTEKDIIHGDLACRNVLIFRIDENEPKKTLIKLTDFGISRGNTMYSKIDCVATAIDTIPVRSSPPEVLRTSNDSIINIFTEKLDIYAMGVLMWEVYSNGKTPWNEIKDQSVVREKVINGERLSRPKNCKCDNKWNLILKCMSQEPDDRPKFLELKNKFEKPLPPVNREYKRQLLKTRSCSPSVNSSRLENCKPTVESSTSLNTKIPAEQSDGYQSTDSTTSSESKKIKVKELSKLFDELVKNQKQETIYQSFQKVNSKPTTPRESIVKLEIPRPELIKLTKWH